MKNSSFAMDEEPHTSSPSTVKTTTEAFKVSICHYYVLYVSSNCKMELY